MPALTKSTRSEIGQAAQDICAACAFAAMAAASFFPAKGRSANTEPLIGEMHLIASIFPHSPSGPFETAVHFQIGHAAVLFNLFPARGVHVAIDDSATKCVAQHF